MSPNWKFLFFLLLLQLFKLCFSKSQPFTSSSSSNSDLQFPCKPPHYSSYPFCNTSLPITTRAQSLISLLTLREKIQQLSNNASAIPRLGIPPYEWWSESLHGIATNGPGVSFNGTIPSATSFPQVIVTAAAFNRTLWSLIGSAIAVEARAMYNLGQAGLTFWAPNINIFRDPRWGRGQETPGEDPMVASAYAIEFVKGFQGGNWGIRHDGFGERRVLEGHDGGSDDGLMLSACCKHFTAYDLELWRNFSRYSFNAVVSEQDLEDTYQPPFRSCIQQGKASCLMCSYNAVNGVPACAQKDLLDKARNEWGFKGYITSDCDAVATVFEYQNYTKSSEDAVADVLKAVMDINCGTYLLRHTLSTIKQGKVQEEDIDKALLNLFSVQLRLGLFDGDPRNGQFGSLGPKDVCTSEHKTLALEATRQGIVLLKNDKKFLPLEKGVDFNLAVIGPLANNASLLGGGYTGIPCSSKGLFEGLQENTKRASYAAGCLDVPCKSRAGFREAIHTVKMADFVVIVVAASKEPVILVLTGGGPLDVTFAKEDPRIASILWVGYPGDSGGRALAEVLFGDFNPGGRLPLTWYPESFTNIPMNDMNMRADPSQAPKKLRLSRPLKVDSSRNILHQAGDTLDYLHIDEVTSCDSLRFFVEITVTNIGDMDGGHTVMLFSRKTKVVKGAPKQKLIGFNRVHTGSYKSTATSILVDPCTHFSFANDYGQWILPLGDHRLMVGDIEQIVSIEIN
ncbi:putative beta-D-xylosidase 6 isoform X1 [Prunus yedoensis var. nudiflora]|uniref:Putative beta-D-xylosidase 6 isoform X1 n=1 Tax=Prunus yedoensis var. nudiflora TaxID=2094558 RepID=A0A314ZDE3_PRUYE|nr:putative beta-D-xylosidase 6 isoform X1 [Prunus yedoensis var. nudiflora]